jgi:DNA-binding NarL/FixJ family response regulator
MTETPEEIAKLRRIGRRASAAQGEREQAVLEALAAGYSQRAVAEAAGFASHRSVARILERQRKADG